MYSPLEHVLHDNYTTAAYNYVQIVYLLPVTYTMLTPRKCSRFEICHEKTISQVQ